MSASDSNLPLVLITGATGYIGAHVLQQTLEAGYPVRATSRPIKVEALRSQYKGKVDVVGIANIATGDYTEALKGVGAIIHVAAPLPGRADPAGMIEGAVHGTTNLLRQAIAAGIKKIIVTSSVATAFDHSKPEDHYSNKVLTDQSWSPATKEEALTGKHNPSWIYAAAKTAAEQEVWKLADKHPEVDITTIGPSYVYGPFAEGVKIPKGDLAALSSVVFFYQNVLPPNASSITIDRVPQQHVPVTVDVRDVARAHVLALRAPPTAEVGRKRILVTGPSLTWVDAVIHLRKVMPEIADRLPKVADGAESKEPLTAMSVDTSRAKAVLGLDNYIDWRKTAEDTVKSLLEIEKSWT